MLPGNFAGAPLLVLDELPEAMQSDIEHFRRDYPAALDFVLTLYEDRGPAREKS